MSEQIDWSKAPEDADKYNTHNDMFYKGERPYLQVFTHKQWRPSVIMKSNALFVYRPIRTPEQSAADEREAAVAEMLGLFGGADSRDTYLMQRLYDAGYRKQSTCDPTGYDD